MTSQLTGSFAHFGNFSVSASKTYNVNTVIARYRRVSYHLISRFAFQMSWLCFTFNIYVLLEHKWRRQKTKQQNRSRPISKNKAVQQKKRRHGLLIYYTVQVRSVIFRHLAKENAFQRLHQQERKKLNIYYYAPTPNGTILCQFGWTCTSQAE
jgi:hypothetical protein